MAGDAGEGEEPGDEAPIGRRARGAAALVGIGLEVVERRRERLEAVERHGDPYDVSGLFLTLASRWNLACRLPPAGRTTIRRLILHHGSLKLKAMQSIGADDAMVTSEVARRLGISPERVRQLERSGELQEIRTRTGVRIYSAVAVEALRQQRASQRRQRLA